MDPNWVKRLKLHFQMGIKLLQNKIFLLLKGDDRGSVDTLHDMIDISSAGPALCSYS